MNDRLVAVVEWNGAVSARREALPELQENEVMIKVETSLISPGTEMVLPRLRRAQPEPGAAPVPFGYANAGTIVAVCGNECTIINPLGELVAHSTNYFSHVTTTINLDYQLLHLDGNWEKLAAARQRYGREIEISDPGQLGCVMLTSHHPERSSKEITAEFGMENWREYYLRAQRYRFTPGEMEKTSTLPAHHRV